MRAIVAGCAGFIGYHLSKRFLDEGYEVVGLDNIVTGQQANVDELSKSRAFTFVNHDVVEPIAVDGPVDLVCNLACPASPVDFGPLRLEILDVCSRGTHEYSNA